MSGVVGGLKYKSGQHGIKNSVCLFRVTVANLVRENNMGLAKIEEENDFAFSIERLLIECG